MRLFKVKLPIVITLILLIVCSGSSVASDIDWQKIKTLQDKEFIKYVKSLDLKGQVALNFWKNIPVSKQTNKYTGYSAKRHLLYI